MQHGVNPEVCHAAAICQIASFMFNRSNGVGKHYL